MKNIKIFFIALLMVIYIAIGIITLIPSVIIYMFNTEKLWMFYFWHEIPRLESKITELKNG